MNDLWTMIWKETKDSVFQGGWSALIRPLLLIGILGVGIPWRLGLQWLALTPIAMGLVLYVPFTVILSFVGDAIAGERERHTLETLLASRISDRAILLGKVIVTTVYAWSTALLGLLLGLLVANLSKGGNWQFYTHGDLLLEALASSLLASLLGVSGGVLISMHSATVRQAQQILIVATLVLIAGGVVVIKVLPAQSISSLSESQIWLIAMAVLAVLDAILLAVSVVSFRRSRLMLS
jgi:ABC-2 type transport system permease protein